MIRPPARARRRVLDRELARAAVGGDDVDAERRDLATEVALAHRHLLFEANDLRLLRSEFETQSRDVERYLDLAACEGEDRDKARALAPGESFPVTVAWYLLARAGGL